MKNENQSKGSFLYLLLFIALISTGCYSTMHISKNEIPVKNRNMYLIHSPDSLYLLSDITVLKRLLSGTRNSADIKKSKSKLVQIYISRDSLIMKNGRLICIDVSSIEKSEVFRFGLIKLAALISVSYLGLVLTILVSVRGYDM